MPTWTYEQASDEADEMCQGRLQAQAASHIQPYEEGGGGGGGGEGGGVLGHL